MLRFLNERFRHMSERAKYTACTADLNSWTDKTHHNQVAGSMTRRCQSEVPRGGEAAEIRRHRPAQVADNFSDGPPLPFMAFLLLGVHSRSGPDMGKRT